MNQLEQIRNKVLGLNEEYSPDEILFSIHHFLMREYGWIPLEELKKYPMETIYNLMGMVRKEKEMTEKSIKKGGKR
ncbi:MAG: hypothetical protein AABY22_02360 [Nanoarchaeota archaeon]